MTTAELDKVTERVAEEFTKEVSEISNSECEYVLEQLLSRFEGLLERVRSSLDRAYQEDTRAELGARREGFRAMSETKEAVLAHQCSPCKIQHSPELYLAPHCADHFCHNYTSLIELESVEAVLKPEVEQEVVHPLLAQLLTTWSCMILDYNGTVNRMIVAGRPHDAKRYEAKMETMAWCSKELTAIAKRLPCVAQHPKQSTEAVREALEGMVAAFNTDYANETTAQITQDAAISVANQALGWPNTRHRACNAPAEVEPQQSTGEVEACLAELRAMFPDVAFVTVQIGCTNTLDADETLRSTRIQVASGKNRGQLVSGKMSLAEAMAQVREWRKANGPA